MVTIGVTGHRFLAEMGKIAAGVDEALRCIERVFGARELKIISPLAEGADRLVARRVLARSRGRLTVVLPLPKAEYMGDFESAGSREAFLALIGHADEVIELPPAVTRDHAYEAASGYVIDHCDVLIAIWDGRQPQGPGGTADIVYEARRRGLPLAWVRAGNRRPGTREALSLGEEQGTVCYERFPSRQERATLAGLAE